MGPGCDPLWTVSGGHPEDRQPAANYGPHPAPRTQERLEAALLGKLELALGELFDVDVLEGHDPHGLDESGRPVDIPDPRVGHRDVEVDLTALTAYLQVDRVGQVEASLRLNDVGEQPDDVAILAIELKLHLGLVLLQVLRAHGSPPPSGRTGPHHHRPSRHLG